jgi:glutamine amidotransferase
LPKVSIIDYRIGNIFSMRNALQRAGLTVEVNSEPTKILDSDAIVLPGVGNFGAAAKNLEPMKATLLDCAVQGKPFLGSCLGMQLLFDDSEEAVGGGLSLIRGSVKRFPEGLKVPHIGWNNIVIKKPCELLDGLGEDSYFYFVHSYYPEPGETEAVVAETSYGVDFASIIAKGNVYGCQFHPEKSGRDGATLLRNFARISKR